MRHAPLILGSLASALVLLAPGHADAADSIKCNLAWDAAKARSSRAGYQNFLNICGGHSRVRDARAWIRDHPPTPTPTPTPRPKPTPTPRRPLTASEVVRLAHAAYGAKNYTEAARYEKQACDGGNAHGCRDLGISYQKGTGVPIDEAIAAQFLKKACEGGEVDTCQAAAAYYYSGKVVTVDKALAAQLYEKACDGKVWNACNSLGLLYDEGEGVPVDKARAAKLIAKACDGELARGCSNLAVFYEEGRGVTANRQTAIDLYQKALRLEPTLQDAKDGLKQLGMTP
ncbi:MAG: sel1 repeat family protein [Sphingomonas sp.]|nr:sel1 repeat family protein [Sphingomonas sp.]